MKKKTLAWAVLPIAALLVACGGNPEPASSGTPSVPSTSQPASTPSTSEPSVTTSEPITTSEPATTSDSTVLSSDPEEPIIHLPAWTDVSASAEQRAFDERFDTMLDDFSGATIRGQTDGVRHEGFLRAQVDSELDNFPNSTDGAIYKAASGTYEAMNFGANGIGFRMRVSQGKVSLANLRLELRGGDAFKTYVIQLADARNSDNEALPELSEEYQDFLINPGQTIEDENTVYENVDGTASETTVLGTILGFHLVANNVEVAGELEIDEVFTFTGATRTVLDDFNRVNVAQVPNAWWGGSASGFIVRPGVTLDLGNVYVTPSLGEATHLVVTAQGDPSDIGVVGLDAQNAVLDIFSWGELTGIENTLVPLATGAYGNYVIEIDQLSGDGIIDKIGFFSAFPIEIAGVFVTSLEEPVLDLTYPHIAPTVTLDSFDREIASLSPDWDASAAIQANIDAGVTGFVSYNHGDLIKTTGGALVLPGVEDYAQVTVGYQAERLDKNAKYVVIAAKGEDLNLFRFKFRGQGSDTEVWFNAALAAEGVKTYGDAAIPSPYVDAAGFTHYVVDLALNGLGVGDLLDMYYTGTSGMEIGAIYFANEDFNLLPAGEADSPIATLTSLDGYSYAGAIALNNLPYVGVQILEAADDADFTSFRIEIGGQAVWIKDGVLKARYANGVLVNPTDKIPATGTTIYFDVATGGFPEENDGWVHFHIGGGFAGSVKLGKLLTADRGFVKSFGGRDAVNVNKTYAYIGGFDIDAAYDYLLISLKATGTNMTYESFRIESPQGTVAYANNPATFQALHADGTPVAASDVIPEAGETILVSVEESAITLAAGQALHIHYADWGDPVGTLQVTDLSAGAKLTPYNLVKLPA